MSGTSVEVPFPETWKGQTDLKRIKNIVSGAIGSFGTKSTLFQIMSQVDGYFLP
jgi:hypothetical protein